MKEIFLGNIMCKKMYLITECSQMAVNSATSVARINDNTRIVACDCYVEHLRLQPKLFRLFLAQFAISVAIYNDNTNIYMNRLHSTGYSISLVGFY